MINYIEKGYGIHKWLADHDAFIREVDGVLVSNLPDEQINQLIADYNPWPTEKAAKFAEIDADFESAVSSLTAGWPAHEIQTWSKQEAEARAYVSDNSAPTPMLLTIAITRGLTVDTLANRVIRDADAFTSASAYYVGLRHKARQQVQSLPNTGDYHLIGDLLSIKFGG